MKRSPNRSVATRLRALLLTVGLVLAGVVGVAGPASAMNAALCTGYDACNAAGYTDHGYGANNDSMYWHEYSGDNCTNYAAYMEVQNGFSTQSQYSPGDASNWGSYFSSYENSTPAVGSIAWWGSSQGDHVAYVERIAYNSDGSVSSITVSEDNWGGSFDWRVYPVSDSANWPSGFLHFKDIPSGGGTGSTTVGIVRNVGGAWQWNLRNSNTSGVADNVFNYGSASTDTPVTGDWNGNGSFTPGIVRNVGGAWQWNLRNSANSGAADIVFTYGSASTDTPVVGDWDGNGTFTPGIVRNSGGALQWHLRNSNTAGVADVTFTYGSTATDTPIVGDWGNNGKTTVGIVRDVSGAWQWNLRYSNTAGVANNIFTYGSFSTDTPVAGDWNGNGSFTPGIVRNVGGAWQWNLRDQANAGAANLVFNYGSASTDTPIVGAW